jgi:hypothetical protein
MGSSSLAQPTPGDPHEPSSGEPTIMAFRRPADRPPSGGNAKARPAGSLSLGGSDALPVVLRLPELDRRHDVPPKVTPVGSTRPWIGIAMWCATGALAVVAAVLILTGKPESPSPADEAPQWQTGSAASGGSDHSAGVGNDRVAPLPGQRLDGTPGSPAIEASGRQAPDRSNGLQPDRPAWRSPGPSGQPSAVAPLTSEVAPAGGFPPAVAPRDMLPGGSNSGSTAPGSAPPDSNLPASGPRQPMANPGAPAGLSDPWPPDQSKLQSDVRSALRPTGVRLDGIQNLETRPTTR